MKPQTFGRNYDIGRMVPVQCVKDDTLRDLNIKDTCFGLLIIYEGMMRLQSNIPEKEEKTAKIRTIEIMIEN